jgi:hypothetical protein
MVNNKSKHCDINIKQISASPTTKQLKAENKFIT